MVRMQSPRTVKFTLYYKGMDNDQLTELDKKYGEIKWRAQELYFEDNGKVARKVFVQTPQNKCYDLESCLFHLRKKLSGENQTQREALHVLEYFNFLYNAKGPQYLDFNINDVDNSGNLNLERSFIAH
jgi:hypothetical protein